jgi:RES domain-containing protein
MMFYRLTQNIHAPQAWSGNGAKQFGGRWNHKGHAAVYVSGSIALACLEILVHTEKTAILSQYCLFRIEIADNEIEYLDKQYLPDNWQQDPAPASTMDVGSGWLENADALALVIPSCIIPYENNAILNPRHPAFAASLSSVEPLDFSFDKRLVISP